MKTWKKIRNTPTSTIALSGPGETGFEICLGHAGEDGIEWIASHRIARGFTLEPVSCHGFRLSRRQ
jgi:hypothetical protein